MSTNVYVQGDLVIVETSFYNEDGNLADPAAVKVDILEPSASTVTTYVYNTDPEVVRTAQGRYQIELTADPIGVWQYYWYAPEGDGQTAGNGAFIVTEKNVANFTYDPGLGDDLSYVRFNIADTDEDGYFLPDQTIKYFLDNVDRNTAIVRCLQNILAQLSTPTFKLDWLSVSTKDAYTGYEKLLKQKAIEFGISLSGLTAGSTISLPGRADSYTATESSLGDP